MLGEWEWVSLGSWVGAVVAAVGAAIAWHNARRAARRAAEANVHRAKAAEAAAEAADALGGIANQLKKRVSLAVVQPRPAPANWLKGGSLHPIRAGVVQNTGEAIVTLGRDVEAYGYRDGAEVATLPVGRANYRLGETVHAAPCEQVAVGPGKLVRLDPDIDFSGAGDLDEIRILVPCSPPTDEHGMHFPISVKVQH